MKFLHWVPYFQDIVPNMSPPPDMDIVSHIMKLERDSNDLITVSCILDDYKKVFFYGFFAFDALFPRYTTTCPYMVMISRKIKFKIDVF